MNLIEGNVQPDGVHLGDYTVPVPRETLAKASDETNLVLGIRPENFELSDDLESGEGIPVDVGVVEELGADAFIYGTLSGIAEDELITAQQIVARIHGGRTPPNRGESVRLLVDDDSRARLLEEDRGPHLCCNDKRLHRTTATHPPSTDQNCRPPARCAGGRLLRARPDRIASCLGSSPHSPTRG